MTRIAPVRLMYNPKVLWFNAKDFDIPVDAAVVVNTARGTEYGHLAEPVFEATPEQLKELHSELKEVLRLGTEADALAAEEAQALSIAAMPAFRELAAEESEEMRPIAVEYLLTCDKAVFYFEADRRIDFRELVRKLAGRLHVRVDMRQIGSRDETRMMGGLGHCGQELCCKRLGGEFCSVSIRMAKEQNLSLNPQKISGVCGKLMCCLRYEYEAYKDFHSRSPKVGDEIKTPDGVAKVVELDVPREVLTLKMEDDKKVKIALKDMIAPTEEGARPSEVDPAAWEETIAGEAVGGVFEASFLTSKFTEESRLGTARAVHRDPRAAHPAKAAAAEQTPAAKDGAKPSRRQRAKQKAAAAQAQAPSAQDAASRSSAKAARGAAGTAAGVAGAPAAAGGTARRRRRGEARSVDTGTVKGAAAQTAPAQPAPKSRQQAPASVRPGQHSSGLRRPANAGAAAASSAGGAASASASAKAAQPASKQGGRSGAQASSKATQGSRRGGGSGKAAGGNGGGTGKAAPGGAAGAVKAAPGNSAGADSRPQASSGADAAATGNSGADHRRPRRRSRGASTKEE